MNRQLFQVDATRSMLFSVWQAVGHFSETDFGPESAAESHAPLLQTMGIRITPSDSRIPETQVSPAPHIATWGELLTQTSLEKLREVFAGMRVIPFSDWTDVHQAADLWYGLLADVIRPLARNDWEFIFYLGDPANRHFFDVDEILDVMGSFTRSGHVTLALDEQEAWSMWSILFGGKQVPEFGLHDDDAKARYRAIFETMDIHRLIIYSETRALVMMSGTHAEILRPPVPAHTHNPYERANFIEGYATALKAGMEPLEGLALGIATSGSIPEGGIRATKAEVLDFLAKWMDNIKIV